MNDAQKKTPLPVAAEQEGKEDKTVYHTDIVPQEAQSVKQRKSQKKWTDFHTERLKNLSLGDFTIQEIADTMGFNRATISRHLQEMKSNNVPGLPPYEEKRLLGLVNSGWSVQQISRKLGYAESTIQKYIPAAKAQLKEKYGAPPLGDVKQREDRERDERKPAQPEKIVIPAAADSSLLAPGMPLLDVLECQISVITDNYCGTIDSLCADPAGLEIRWHDDTQKGQLIIRVEPKEEQS